MLRLNLNKLLAEHGFHRATIVQGRRMWVRGTEAVIRHESNSRLYRLYSKQFLEFVDKDNNSKTLAYDDPTLNDALMKFIGGNDDNKQETN